MFIHQTRLPHILGPELYYRPGQYDQELANLFLPAWHIVAGYEELNRDGDFVTRELFGVPLLLKNFDGEVHAFLNVCTHRHCLLTSEPFGNKQKLACQYHGWEFCKDGSTARIPDARGFRPLTGGPEQLRKFAVQIRGPLVMVSLAEHPLPLEDRFGALAEPCDEFPAERWQLAEAWDYGFESNWKIPVENTLESYHLPLVHPKSLVNFASEEAITHELYPNAAVMRSPTVSTSLYRMLAKWVLPRLDDDCSIDRYRLFHGFPNLFVIRIDAMLQVMVVFPLSPTTCKMTVRVYALRAKRETWVSRCLTWGWGKLKVRIVRQVLSEDARLYPDLQRGMENSPFTGSISAREELVYGFQDYVRRHCSKGHQTELKPNEATPQVSESAT